LELLKKKTAKSSSTKQQGPPGVPSNSQVEWNGTPVVTSTGERRDLHWSHVTWPGNTSMESRLGRHWNDNW